MRNQKNFNNTNNSIWFITSELEGVRASSFRQERWCRAFLDCGTSLRIFNLRGAFEYCDRKISNHDEFTKFRKESIKKKIGEKNSIREGFFVKIARRIKHLLLVDLYLPNVILMFINIFIATKFEKKVVLIMASSPPFSTAIIGALIKFFFPKKVVLAIDMRDAWAQHQSLGGIKRLKKIIEASVLRKADFLSTVSLGLSKEFESKYGVAVEVMYNVATQYFEKKRPVFFDAWKNISPMINPSKNLIVYTGSIPEGFYDIDLIVGTIDKINERHQEFKSRFQFIFIGACEELRKKSLEKKISNFDIIFVPHISHDLIYFAQTNAWALLFFGYLGESNGGVVSTKLFEYIHCQKPIIPLNISPNSDVDLILKKYCNSSLYLNREEDIIKCLKVAFRNKGNNLPIGIHINALGELAEDYKIYAKKIVAIL